MSTVVLTEPRPQAMTGARTRLPTVTMGLAAVWFLPLNFAVFSADTRMIYLALIAVGGVGSVTLLLRGDRGAAAVAGGGAALLVVTGVASGPREATVLFVLQVATGFALHRSVRRPVLLAVFLATTSVASLLLDWIAGRHVYLSLFQGQRFTSVLGEGFRARGLIGSAVPAGLLAVVLLGVILLAATALPRRSGLLAVASAAAAVSVAAITTGTRSALICLGLLLVLLLLDALWGRRDVLRWNLSRPIVAVVVVAAVLLVWQPGVLTNSRLFSYTGLARTDSYEVRSQALAVVSRLHRTCDFCVVVGSGQGDLQRRLVDGASINGLSTLDNQLVSIYWDFGLLGLGLIAAGVRVAVSVLRRSAAPERRAGAIGVLMLVVVGFFYEPLYLSTGAVLLGFCVGGLTCAERQEPT